MLVLFLTLYKKIIQTSNIFHQLTRIELILLCEEIILQLPYIAWKIGFFWFVCTTNFVCKCKTQIGKRNGAFWRPKIHKHFFLVFIETLYTGWFWYVDPNGLNINIFSNNRTGFKDIDCFRHLHYASYS